jgi:hypothetical protein
MDSTDGTLVRESTISISDGPVLGSTRNKYGIRTTMRCKSVTRRQIADTADDNTVKTGNILSPAIQEDISAIQVDVSAINEDISARKKKKDRVKMMDINEAHHNMGYMGEAALRRFLNHHNIKATGKFPNCVSCMKMKGQNEAVSKVATNPDKYPGQRLHTDASGPLALPMGRKNIG